MNIDTILNECKEKGFVVLVKNTYPDIRTVILEAEGRGYLRKTQPGVYRLTPLGFDVLDAGGVDSYLKMVILSRESRETQNPKTKQFTINIMRSKVVIPCSPFEFISIAVTIIGVIATILQLMFGIF